ncbi:hypothetical protein PROFUN_07297 [Planoprotostelium fungivorum]|uniref:DAGKc domain-containing protein n=1 Tax=Planoprotostelium fungivorum TaxID=1890364 RepID=A0A2P6NM49_9EUKA|nr:hypothetical protein PROFUN_07297 [Planoprotostelium fungivorum]
MMRCDVRHTEELAQRKKIRRNSVSTGYSLALTTTSSEATDKEMASAESGKTFTAQSVSNHDAQVPPIVFNKHTTTTTTTTTSVTTIPANPHNHTKRRMSLKAILHHRENPANHTNHSNHSVSSNHYNYSSATPNSTSLNSYYSNGGSDHVNNGNPSGSTSLSSYPNMPGPYVIQSHGSKPRPRSAEFNRNLYAESSSSYSQEEYRDLDNFQPHTEAIDPSRIDDYMPPTILKPSGAVQIPVRKVAIVYNPKSGAQKGEKLARKTEKILNAHGIAVTMLMTERRGHGEEIARDIPLDDTDVLCFLGGDGTFHECLNGFMRRKDNAKDRVALAVLPGGTGNSFALELQGNNRMSSCIKSILRGITVNIDIARMYFPTVDETVFSFNSVHWGMGSKINVTAEKLRWMGKAIRYSTAAALELMRGSTTEAIFEMVDKDGKFFEVRGHYSLLVANNIMSTLKGMKMVPNAKINDGLIDLLLIKSGKMMDLVSIFKRVYNGTHTELDYVDYYQVKSFSLIPFVEHDGFDTEPPEVAEELLDIDGELKGKTPFKCTMMPREIKVIEHYTPKQAEHRDRPKREQQ